MDREAYRQNIAAMWRIVRQLDQLRLLNVEISAKRIGNAAEYQAARALRRALDDIPNFPAQPNVED